MLPKKTFWHQFYNISKFTFTTLVADPENIEANFRDYLGGFSANVQDMLSKFDFYSIIKRMVGSSALYLTIKEFNAPHRYLGPDGLAQFKDMFMNTGISTYIWVISKGKPVERAGKVRLIDASHCFEPRRRSIGTKRNDISDQCRELIVKAYAFFANGVFGNKAGIYCECKIFNTEEFGYSKITVERPQKDEASNIIKKKGKPVADANLRNTEKAPLTEDIDEYFKREVLPYFPDAWVDKTKTNIGYEKYL